MARIAKRIAATPRTAKAHQLPIRIAAIARAPYWGPAIEDCAKSNLMSRRDSPHPNPPPQGGEGARLKFPPLQAGEGGARRVSDGRVGAGTAARNRVSAWPRAILR